MASNPQLNGSEQWVDTQNGLVSREIFVNDAIYQQEQEQVFARVWLFIGHESQIPNPGDYFTSYMGEESVILTRDQQHQIHVFLNTCTHRGMKVCRYDEGHTTVFTCPYHGWSFACDGGLVGVPHYRAAYHEQLDRSKWGLIEVAQMQTYKGTVWATWDPSAPPLMSYLGDMIPYLDVLLDRRDGREGGSDILGGVQRWNDASDASKGVIARRYPYNYQMGMGCEHSREDWPGVISEGISEQNQRGFYKRWAELMAGQS